LSREMTKRPVLDIGLRDARSRIQERREIQVTSKFGFAAKVPSSCSDKAFKHYPEWNWHFDISSSPIPLTSVSSVKRGRACFFDTPRVTLAASRRSA